MDGNIIQIENLSKYFGPTVALKNINLSIKYNEIHALCGENGAGKSTLMKILNGYYPYGSYQGDFYIEGKKCYFTCPQDSIDSGISMIYQEISILKFMTVADNIFAGDFPVRYGIVDNHTLHKKAAEVLKIVDLNVPTSTIAGTLNASQQQLLMIAHAMIKQPKILILDEPTSALTINEFNKLMVILKNLKNNGVTCIYISHKLDEVAKIADRLTILRDGETVETLEREEFDINRVIFDMVGKRLENAYPKRNVEIGEEVLRVENLSVPNSRIKGRYFVKDLSFNLRRGEILGLAGLVGAGRSETLNALYGYIKKSSGTVIINGKIVSINSPAQAIKNGIALLTEDRKAEGIFEFMSVRQNMTASNIRKICTGIFINRPLENRVVDDNIKRYRIKVPEIRSKIENLSGGNQQKVVLAKSLLSSPKIVLLDEPTRGIDVGSKYEIYNLMNELVESGYSIVMVSSELPELLNMCDRVVVMTNGIGKAEFTKEEATEENVMRAAVSAN